MSSTGGRKRALNELVKDRSKRHRSDFDYSDSSSNSDSDSSGTNETSSDSSNNHSQNIKREKNIVQENTMVGNPLNNKIHHDSESVHDEDASVANSSKESSTKPKGTKKKVDSNDNVSSEVLDFKRITKPSPENIKLPNIYSSSNLEVLSRGTLLYGRRFKNKETERLVDNAIVPKLKPEFEKMNKYKRPTAIAQVEYKPPDEVLTNDYEFEANELVYLDRDEIKRTTKVELPRQDITNAIHYYVADRIKTRFNLSEKEYDEKFSRIFDGSSLLALSTVFTSWVEELIGDQTYKAYMETTNTHNEKLSSIDEFIRIYDESSDGDGKDDNTGSSDNESGDETSSSEEIGLSDEESKFKSSFLIKKEEEEE